MCALDVYDWCMTRTNIEIDDELIAAVMAENHLSTKREAVDFALRKVRKRTVTLEDLRSLRGIGFEPDLSEIRPDDRHRRMP